MRLRHLEIFHAVMRSGSVSAAADLLSLSQSAASKALAQAEHALGISLFQRVRGRLVHTREAEQLYAQTTLLFAQAKNVERLARTLKRNPADHLRIGCLPSLGLGLLPKALSAFRQRCPGASLEIITGNGDELLERIQVHELDIALSYDMPMRQGLGRLTLGSVEVVHLAPREPGHGATENTPIRLASLDPARWISIGGSDPLALKIRDVCDQLQLPEPSLMVETRTYYIAAALARQGLGFTLVDEFTAHAIGQDLPTRRLDPPISVEMVAFHDAAGVRSLAFDTLITVLRDQLPGSPR